VSDLLLGVIADDFTGATDIANTLVRGGMRTVMTIGAPRADAEYDDVDALVVAVKTRSIPAADAVAQSLAALDALRRRGARQIVFKYCSTFDSTDAGNIGPVADALLEHTGLALAIHCPAFPANRRRLFGGYLFVGDVLLSESGMRDHPVTPMRDPNLVRVLQRQTPERVGLLDFSIVRRGHSAIADALRMNAQAGFRHVIVDAVGDDDLVEIGTAAVDAGTYLICGGSGIALGLPRALQPDAFGSQDADRLPAVEGAAAILAGSCSEATRAQIAFAQHRFPVFDLNAGSYDEPPRRVAEALAWADAELGDRPILVVASADPQRVAANQSRYGAAEAGARVERILAGIARGLRDRGVARFVVAGGETSGAVVAALGVEALRIGPQIDPGVPWTATLDDAPVALALKSGNFGTEDFFVRALQQLS
jgi:3-dehydrotetronate 4-kinase